MLARGGVKELLLVAVLMPCRVASLGLLWQRWHLRWCAFRDLQDWPACACDLHQEPESLQPDGSRSVHVHLSVLCIRVGGGAGHDSEDSTEEGPQSVTRLVH